MDDGELIWPGHDEQWFRERSREAWAAILRDADPCCCDDAHTIQPCGPCRCDDHDKCSEPASAPV
jgi:hypothetical protein